MPIFDIHCPDCDYEGEVILTGGAVLACPVCGGTKAEKLMSPTSALSGKTPMRHPGPNDTACCGSSPQSAGCAGPGSCCGKNFGQ
jgi:putative FmdB family regulatory protein